MGEAGDASQPHRPVLYHAVVSALRPEAGGCFLDGTLGAGGHAAGLLEASAPDGQLLGLDRDPLALRLAGDSLARFGSRVHLKHGSFAEMARWVGELGWTSLDGILLDLGLSSMQVDDPQRGFAFGAEGPLDMRFDPGQVTTAAELVNGLSETALAELIGQLGEEPHARRVARAIVAARPLRTTAELAHVVAQATGGRRGRIHPATRTFQALRMAVNEELEALEAGLRQATDLLAPGGRLAVIAFHSLEDRMVKRWLRQESRDCLCPPGQPACTCGHVARLKLVTPHPVRAEPAEVRANPRARSARLRVAERLRLA